MLVSIPTARLRALSFAARINVYAISLTTLWTPLNTVLIQQRVSQTVPEAIQGSAVGLISLVGIGTAALVQPFAGRVSDLAPLRDRRRPFIVGGTCLDLIFLLLLWWTPSFTWLLLAYVLLQISSNFAQAALQALIPDLIDPPELGLAAGVKNAFDVLGSALGLLGVGLLLRAGAGTGAVLVFLGAVLVLGAALTLVWVPPIPSLPSGARASGLEDLIRRSIRPGVLARGMIGHRAFTLAVLTRFLFLLGFYPVQRFFFFFLQDRFHVSGAAERTSFYALGALLLGIVGALVAGPLSDRLGRARVLRASIAISALGLLGTALAPSLLFLAGIGSLLALGSGAFQAVSWALLGDHIPRGYGAQYYGLANLATAGASALAGLYGPLVDVVNAVLPAGTYTIAFGLAALVTLGSLLPLARLSNRIVV
jgi:MFS family permease